MNTVHALRPEPVELGGDTPTMRPIALLQLVGPAVAYHVGETLHAAFPDRFRASPNLKKIVDAAIA